MVKQKAFWNFTLACILIAVVNAVSLILIGPYGPSGMAVSVSLPLLSLIPEVMETYPTLNLLLPAFYIAATWGLGTIIGSFVAALSSGNFTIRRPTRGQIIRSLTGGFLMGSAVLMAAGCNITHLGLVPLLVPASILALTGIVIGAYAGVRFMSWRMSRQVRV